MKSGAQSRWFKICLMSTFLLASLTMGSPSMAQDEETSASSTAARIGAVALDVILIRPIGVGQTVAGSVFFAVAAPLTYPGGKDDFDLAYETFVEAPVDDTFRRELGQF